MGKYKYGDKPTSAIREYRVWTDMKQRCFNPRHQRYPGWGGRGITVCDRWRNSFKAFYEDMGPRPDWAYCIDRIDNDGNYEPTNCRWADVQMSAENKRKPKGNPDIAFTRAFLQPQAKSRLTRWLAKGRAHEERGQAEKAERCFDKATYWLDRANKARGW